MTQIKLSGLKESGGKKNWNQIDLGSSQSNQIDSGNNLATPSTVINRVILTEQLLKLHMSISYWSAPKTKKLSRLSNESQN